MALVVFLRGANVGGHKKFQPSTLATELAELGVVSVGAAGTFVVGGKIGPASLRVEILRRLPFKTELMIVLDARSSTSRAQKYLSTPLPREVCDGL